MSRETYAALFTAIGTTYGTGDGSTTFKLPNLTDKFIQGSTTAGTTKAAGLPNIEGYFTIRPSSGTAALISRRSGAISTAKTEDNSASVTNISAASKQFEQVNFDASNSNSIYGNSTTVQPPAVTMKFAIYAGYTSLHRWLRTA